MKKILHFLSAAVVVACAASSFAAESDRKLSVLAVGAHPDDIEQHVGGTLLKYKAQGAKIFFVLTTSGNTGSSEKRDPAEIGRFREAEQLASAKT